MFVGRRVDLLATTAFRLPVPGPFTRTRGAASATVGLDGARLTAVSVHLPLQPAQRVRHARMVRSRLAASTAAGAGTVSLAIAGDLNEPPGGPAWAVLGAGLTDAAVADGSEPAPTFTARRPRRRIDAVLVGSGVRVGSLRVPGSTGGPAGGGRAGMWPDVTPHDLWSASDHLPLVADLLLGSDG